MHFILESYPHVITGLTRKPNNNKELEIIQI